MWEQDIEKNEYIYDCEPLQLAVKVGITGVLIGLVIVIIYRSLIIILSLEPSYNLVLTSQLGVLNQIGFACSIFASLGYVGVFSMKNSKLGIVFPLMTIISYNGFIIYLNILFQTGMYTSEIHIFSSSILNYGLAIISGLVLFTLRKVSANPRFLYIFAMFTITRLFLSDTIWLLIWYLLVSFPLYDDFGHLISTLYYLIFSLVSSLLVIKFFILESRNGCIGENALQERPFS